MKIEDDEGSSPINCGFEVVADEDVGIFSHGGSVGRLDAILDA